MLYDLTWVDNFQGRRPKWSYMNDDPNSNAAMRVPKSGCCVKWFATRDIPQGEEICFPYGVDTDDWKESTTVVQAGEKRARKQTDRFGANTQPRPKSKGRQSGAQRGSRQQHTSQVLAQEVNHLF